MAVKYDNTKYLVYTLLMLYLFLKLIKCHGYGFSDPPLLLTLNMSLSNTFKYVLIISVFSSPLRGNRHVTICTRPAIK